MRAQNQRGCITMPVDELSPCLNGKGFIDISLLAPLRFSDLHWMHHHIMVPIAEMINALILLRK